MKRRRLTRAALCVLTAAALCALCGAAPFARAQQSEGADTGRESAAEDSREDMFDPFMKGVLQSGPTDELPWRDSADFLSAVKEQDCPVLLGGYKTVLKDPLPGEEYNVHLAARYICGTVLEPGKILSQNHTAGPYVKERGYQEGPTYNGTQVTTTVGGGVCKIASTLFNTVVLSDLKVVERHTHNMPVPYVPYGQDATVYYGAKDFKFMNNTDHPVLIWAQGIDNTLYIAFYGKTAPPKVAWSHTVLRVFKAPVCYQKNRALPPGTEKLLHEGMDGAIVRSRITLTYPDGHTVVRDMGRSCYNPLPYIKEIGG